MSVQICVECNRKMRVEKNGVVWEDLIPPDVPYKLYMADLWKCPGCDWQIITGSATTPFAEHFEPGYAEKAKRAMVRVI